MANNSWVVFMLQSQTANEDLNFELKLELRAPYVGFLLLENKLIGACFAQ